MCYCKVIHLSSADHYLWDTFHMCHVDDLSVKIKLINRRSRVLLEKLTGSQPVKFPAYYGTQSFISHLQAPATSSYP